MPSSQILKKKKKNNNYKIAQHIAREMAVRNEIDIINVILCECARARPFFRVQFLSLDYDFRLGIYDVFMAAQCLLSARCASCAVRRALIVKEKLV